MDELNGQGALNAQDIMHSVSRRLSIKNRLQRYFLLISLAIIVLMSGFSLWYFHSSIMKESTTMIRNKLLLADLFMQEKRKDTEELAKRLAADRSIQIGLGIESGRKISEYIEPFEQADGNFRIAVFDMQSRLLTEGGGTFADERQLVQSALKGEGITEPKQIDAGGMRSPAYVSAVPVLYGDETIGAVLVEFVFTANSDFFADLARNLECEVAVYIDGASVVSTGELQIDSRLYKTIAYSGKTYESISLTASGLNEYKAIADSSSNPAAVLRVHLSSLQYRNVFLTAIIVYVALATVITIIVISIVLRVSASILNPIEQLLQDVNIVRSGDLSHEVILKVQDEIGRLGMSFNELRSQLSEKISTIQDMNASLEETIQERTATINTLNDKMKHYLSPQLYASIAGGERDASVEHHYRKKLTVFFSDVVGFTATTESLEAEDLSTLLNSYLDNMAEIAEKYGGTIDKYVGDAIMVFFGDPVFTSDKDHALRAVKMAMEMQARMISFREEWKDKGLQNPFHVRVGINTGYCTVGNFGSETKMDYTIIGNNVNLAARFEAAAEPDTILISPETYTLVRDQIDCVEAGEFTLKGVSGTIKAYNPIRVKGNKSALEFAKVTPKGELIFPDRPMNLNVLSKAEKRDLLLSLKATFQDIVDVKPSSPSEAKKPAVRSLDGEESKAKKVNSGEKD